MKKLLVRSYLVVFLSVFATAIYAQTSIACYGNTEPGTTVEVFDWRQEEFSAWIIRSNQPNNNFIIPSPYSVAYGNITNDDFLRNLSQDNFNPADGWEILYHNFGKASIGTDQPSFALYNRLTAEVIAFFHILPTNGLTPTNVILELGHSITEEFLTVAGTFSNLNDPNNTIDAITDNYPFGFFQISSGVMGPNWYHVYGTVAYDPCVCEKESGLSVSPYLEYISNGIRDVDRYQPYTFYTPGSRRFDTQIQEFFPVYDNPLGLFSVLERPGFERYKETFTNENGQTEIRELYRYKGDLRYRVNQTAGLGEVPISITASLRWPNDCLVGDGVFTREAGLVSSPSMELACLAETTLAVSREMDNPNGPRYDYVGIECSTPPQLFLSVVLEEEGSGLRSQFTASYAINVEEIDDAQVDWGSPILISENPAPINTCNESSLPSPLTDEALAAFCQSNYNPLLTIEQAFQRTENEEPIGSEPLFDLELYPNPVGDRLWLTIPESFANTELNFELFDLTGREIVRIPSISVATSRHEVPIDWSRYPKGIYLVTISGNDGYQQTFRITKQ